MKKRRTLIISLLLVAALCLGVGYAVTNGNVKVTGEVYNAPHDLNLVFVESGCSLTAAHINGESVTDPATTGSTVSVVDGAISATFNVNGISHTGDSVTATFMVKNNNQYKVKITSIVPEIVGGSASAFFTVTPTWLGGYQLNDELDAGETASFTLTVEMNKITAEELDGDFVVTVNAQSAS